MFPPSKTAAIRTVLLACDDPARAAAITASLAAGGIEVAAAAGASSPPVDVAAIVIAHASGSPATFAAIDPELPVILIGDPSVSDARAWEVLRDMDGDALCAAVARAAAMWGLVLENRRLSAALEDQPDDALVGRSVAIEAAREAIAAVAAAGVDVLLRGEAGTGKSRVARTIHRGSARRRDPFVAIACAAIPDSVIDAELAAVATGGTLFLDDLAGASPTLRARLRDLVARRGGDPAALRIVAAHGDDRQDGATLPLIADLFGTDCAQLRLPPLRERLDDVPALFAHLLDSAAGRLRVPVPPMSPAVRRRLVEHDWPGNIRELADFADRVVSGLVEAESPPQSSAALPQRVDSFERGEICAALAASGGDAGAAMTALGLPRKTFYYKVQRHGIDVASFRTRAAPRATAPDAKKPGHL
ncbi:MAG TPA: sigma 54-interacting transcriptional regulator [Sphingomonas sp.]|nr:sigma 54-interacting transcriptional regulator [Sphingomonas sp.]